jgi:hypothetical protein
MLLARLVTGRYEQSGEYQPRTGLAANQGWFSRLIAAILIRRRVG